MIYLKNERTDPAWNLAAEEYLMRRGGDESFFLLWRNSPAVIIGRHQNTAEEINESFVEANRIAVVRRLSGGGAVYHDEGNLNFTFICPDSARSVSLVPDFRRFTAPLSRLLIRLGLPVEFSGRNDLILNGKKFSGNAQARLNGHLLHHGTILFNVDLERMTRALSVTPDKFHSKAVASVRSRVTNLADFLPAAITLADFAALFHEEIRQEQGKRGTEREYSSSEEEAIERLRREKYETWEWNYGKNPPSNLRAAKRFPWGKVCVDLNLTGGKIASAILSGDFFTDESPDLLIQKMRGLPFRQEAIRQTITDDLLRRVFPLLTQTQFLALLFAESENSPIPQKECLRKTSAEH